MARTHRRTAAFIAAAALLAPWGAGAARIDRLSPEALDAKAREDAALLYHYAAGIARLAGDLRRNGALWSKAKDAQLTPDERRLALELFQQVLAYEVALDGMSRFHLDFWRIDVLKDPTRHARHFVLGFAAYCQQLALGLLFVDRTLGKPQFEKLLDEGSPEDGIPPGAYAKLKWNVVHVQDVGKVFAAHQYHKLLARKHYAALRADERMRFVVEEAERRYAETKERLATRGHKLFAGNALDILKDKGHEAWFPLQTEVATLMGDTRVARSDRALISYEQVAEAVRRSRPGDVIVERRNWYLSNVGLPGFWPHAALHLGTPAELAAAFDGDEAITAHYGAPFSQALASRFPAAWASYASPDEDGHPRRLIEAISEGVVFTSAEHSLRADYAAALRPRLPPLEIARAIERAFGYAGRPYDFDFDFFTDRELVCSELVFKAYEPRADARGLKLDLVRMVGRMTLPPNAMIAQFDRELGTGAQQLDFVWFLDGREKGRRAEWADVGALRASHRRPKWDIAQK